jgi:hypothetical protein
MTEANPDRETARHSTQFAYISFREHVVLASKHWRLLAVSAVGTFGFLWTMLEAAGFILDVSFKGWPRYLLLCAISVLAGLGALVIRYLNAVPPGFEDENAEIQAIVRLQRPLWEFRLARSLLAQRLNALDRALQNMTTGRVFVEGRKIRGREYMEWLTNRPDNLLRLIDVAKVLLLRDLPEACSSSSGAPADPIKIREAVDRIAVLYRDTLDFEKSGKALEPPKAFQKVHALQAGWSDVIRGALKQVYGFLDSILALDPKADSNLTYEIVFDEPKNVSEFCAEMARLQSSPDDWLDEY